MYTSDHHFALVDIFEFFRMLTFPATFTSGKGSHVLLFNLNVIYQLVIIINYIFRSMAFVKPVPPVVNV